MVRQYFSNRKETSDDLEQIHRDLFNDNASPEKIKLFHELCKSAHSFLPSERCRGKKCVLGISCGNLDSKIMFIGEAPGRNGAERTGIPIYGDPAGDNFERILMKVGKGRIGRDSFYITNTFLWNPVNEQGNNDRPSEQEIDSALEFLKRQIEIVNPELVIALGNTAYNTLDKINKLPVYNSPMKDLSGKIFRWTENMYIGAMYHPSPRVVGTHRSIDQMSNDLRSILKSYISQRNNYE